MKLQFLISILCFHISYASLYEELRIDQLIDEQAIFKTAMYYYAKAEFEHALSFLEKLESSSNSFMRACSCHHRAIIYLKQQNFDMAERFFLRALAEKEKPIEVYNNIGSLYWILDRKEEARAAIEHGAREGDSLAMAKMACFIGKENLDLKPQLKHKLEFMKAQLAKKERQEKNNKQLKEKQRTITKQNEESKPEAVNDDLPKTVKRKKKHKAKRESEKVEQTSQYSMLYKVIEEFKETGKGKAHATNTLARANDKNGFTHSEDLESEFINWDERYILDHSLINSLNDTSDLVSMYCDPKGNYVIGMSLKYIYTWDINEGKCIAMKELAPKVTISLSYPRVAIGWIEDTLDIYINTPSEIIRVNVLDDVPYHLVYQKTGNIWFTQDSRSCFSNDGSLCATTCSLIENKRNRKGEQKHYLVYWDFKNNLMKTLSIDQNLVQSIVALQFRLDNKKLFALLNNGYVKVWDIASAKIEETIQLINEPIAGGCISTQGTHCCVMNKAGYIQLFQLANANGKSLFPRNCYTGFFSLDGKYILVASTDGFFYMIDNNGNVIWKYLITNKLVQLRLSSDNQVLLTRSRPSNIHVWKRKERNKPLFKEVIFNSVDKIIKAQIPRIWFNSDAITLKDITKRQNVTAIACDSEGDNVMVAMADSMELIIKRNKSPEFIFKTQHKDYIWTLGYSRTHNMIAAGCADGTISLWNLTTKELCSTFEYQEGRAVWSLAFDENSKKIFAGYENGFIKEWDFEKKTWVKDFKGHSAKINDVKLITVMKEGDPFTLLVSASDDKTVKVWSPEQAQCIYTFKDHTKPVTRLEYCSKFYIVVSAGEDRTLRFWNVIQGTCQLVQQLKPLPIKKIDVNDNDTISVIYDDYTIEYYSISANERTA